LGLEAVNQKEQGVTITASVLGGIHCVSRWETRRQRRTGFVRSCTRGRAVHYGQVSVLPSVSNGCWFCAAFVLAPVGVFSDHL